MNDYIKEMREIIGHRPLLTIGCGVIIENEQEEILLQTRTDDGKWGTPGGGMNFGETFVETAVREVYEETGLTVRDLELFGVYSGAHCVVEYPNKDLCFGAVIIFKTSVYNGEIIPDTDESSELKFFSKESLPQNINPTCKKWIEHWRQGCKAVVVE